jgi:hypothetical protein
MSKKIINIPKIFSSLSLAILALSATILPASAQLSVESDPFNVVEPTNSSSCTINRPCIIYPKEQTFNPPITDTKRWRDSDMTYKVNGSSSGAGNFVPEIQAGAECRIQVRRFERQANDPVAGHNAIMNRLKAANTFTEMDQDGDGQNDTMVIPFNPTNGCGFTLPAGEQTFVDWQISILVVNPDNTAYAANPAYFFKFGVVGITFIR